MERNNRVATAVRRALIMSALTTAGVAAPALAQENIGEITVTGSRILQPNIQGPSPVTVIGAQDIKVTGVTKVEDLINRLPQVFADQGGNISNGATGTATINLRNAGSQRTLVLVNGRRLPAGDVYDPSVDVNQIPAPLIERVEVLTGGASAIYGSDAVAGVVNFILNDSFEGVQFDVNYNFFNHHNSNAVADVVESRGFALPKKTVNDGGVTEASLLMGSNFADDRGNATVFLGYREGKALLQAKRDYSACALSTGATSFGCGGSSTSFPGRFIDLNSGANLTVADSSGTVRPWTTADLYNYGPLNYYQRPSTRYVLDAFAHYNLNDNAQIYTEMMFHDDHTVAQIAPSGLFGLVTDISCSNPLLSADWVDNICTQNGLTAADSASMFILRRNIEGGGRQDDIRHTSYRGVVGFKGTFADHWSYDVSGQYGTVVFQEKYLNDFSFTRAGRAMDVVDDGSGNAVCRSALDGSDPACVPYNIWSLGGVTPEAIAYLQTPGFASGATEQTVFTGSLSADLGAYGLKFPMAESGVGIAFGAEYRQEKLRNNTDTAFETGDLFGQGGPTIGVTGAFHVKDLFLETRVPIVEGRTGAEEFSLNASYRYSDYSTGATTDTYGIGLVWAPIEDLRFRGGYRQAVRAPNVIELFRAQSIGLYDNDFDPCAGAVPVATLAQCINTGVTAAQYGTIIDSAAGQYNALFGGNPDLSPETATGWSAGIVWTPAFIEGFNATIDYSTGEIKDQVSTLPPTTTLTQCLETGDPLFCSLITRDQLGTLWALPAARIVATNQNLSTGESTWLDVALNYQHEIGRFGSLAFNLIGTQLIKITNEPIPGLGKYDCKGLYGSGNCGTPNPEWRHSLRTTWMTPWNANVTLTWRHFDAVLFDRTSSNPLLTGPFNEVDRKLDAQDYIDLSASYTFMEKYTASLGFNNLLDDDPPVSSQVGAGFGNGNTFPQVYDSMGRYVFMSLTAKF